MQRTSAVLEMVKRREEMKHENLHLSMAIFEKRIQLRDFAGSLISELSTSVQNCRYVFIFLKMKKIVLIFMEFFFVILDQFLHMLRYLLININMFHQVDRHTHLLRPGVHPQQDLTIIIMSWV